jgi:chemotaxis protein methyltransferase CheR
MNRGQATNQLRILLVSSGAPWVDTLSNWLRVHGYTVDRLTTRAADPYALQATQPDLILLDLEALSGSSLLERLRVLERLTSFAQLPVIAIAPDVTLEFELLDVYDFLSQPLNYDRLLANIRRLEQTPPVRPETSELTDAQWERYHHHLSLHTGLQFTRRNSVLLERGLHRRMCAVGAADYDIYYRYLTRFADSRNELKKLLSLLTVGETTFFRYKNHREAFVRYMLPDLIAQRRRSRNLRIWSAGCSTGEEPYGIAMLLQEHFPELAGWDVQIVATDINKRALRAAREGIYGRRALRMVEEPYLSRYFARLGELHVVDPQLRQRISFNYLNLKESDWPEIPSEHFDLIFCRNVMIYFDLATTRQIVDRFANALRPGGFLLLGHAETLQNVSDRFQRLHRERAFLYQLQESPPRPVAPKLPSEPAAPAPVATTVVPGNQAVGASPATMGTGARNLRAEQLFQRAQTDFTYERFAEAQEKYTETLALQPDHQGALIGMGLLNANNGDAAGARLFCEQAITVNDLFPDSYFLLGLILELEGDAIQAVKEMEKALWLSPCFIVPRHALFRHHRRVGDLRAARRELVNVIRCLEKERPATIIPYSGGLSREVFLENCRADLSRLSEIP